jgi:hypothetical protein
VPIEHGFSPALEQWSAGKTSPDWHVPLHGVNAFARSAVADMKELPDGNLLLVERYGEIVLIDPKGRELLRKRPIYPGIKIEDLPQHIGDWDKHLKGAEATAAAAITDHDLVLAPDDAAVAFLVPISAVVDRNSNDLFLADFWYLTDAKGPEAISVKNGASTEARMVSLGRDEERPVSALAVCNGTLMTGHDDGTIAFEAFPKHDPDAERIRRVQDDSAEFRSFLDVGCLGNDYAYSVTWEGAHGQVQLWNLATRAMVDEFGGNSHGHPGMAFSGIASTDARHFMSVGDLDVRLWTVAAGKFAFVGQHFLHESDTSSYSGAVLSGEEFISWDGIRLWRIPFNGAAPSVYAGPPVEADH